jgi:hypothetical protein
VTLVVNLLETFLGDGAGDALLLLLFDAPNAALARVHASASSRRQLLKVARRRIAVAGTE